MELSCWTRCERRQSEHMKLMALANSMKTDFNFYETVALFFLSKQSMNEIEYFHLRFETVAMNSAAKTSIGSILYRGSREYTPSQFKLSVRLPTSLWFQNIHKQRLKTGNTKSMSTQIICVTSWNYHSSSSTALQWTNRQMHKQTADWYKGTLTKTNHSQTCTLLLSSFQWLRQGTILLYSILYHWWW